MRLMTSAVPTICSLCGGGLGDVRVMVAGQQFHIRCTHVAREARIAELEAELRSVRQRIMTDLDNERASDRAAQVAILRAIDNALKGASMRGTP